MLTNRNQLLLRLFVKVFVLVIFSKTIKGGQGDNTTETCRENRWLGELTMKKSQYSTVAFDSVIFLVNIAVLYYQ